MSIRIHFGAMALATLVAGGGCGEQAEMSTTGSTETKQQDFKSCCDWGEPNGTGVNIAENPPGPLNQFGIAISGVGQWFLAGFQNSTSGGSVTAVGWFANGSTSSAKSANGTATYANYGGTWYPLLSITGSAGSSYFTGTNSPNYPIVWVNDPDYGATPLYGRFLNGVLIYVVAPDGRHTYDVKLGGTMALDSQKDPTGQGQLLNGLTITVSPHGANTYTGFCNNVGVNEPALLYQGAAFDPMTANRTDSANSVTLTCQSGGIATCMSWGYTTWDSTGALSPTQESYHQSCVHLKRAAYYGDGQAFTINGTLINKQDSQGNPIWKDDMTKLEALWDEKGALCVNAKYRRHPDLPNNTYVVNKPACDDSYWKMSWLTASALP